MLRYVKVEYWLDKIAKKYPESIEKVREFLKRPEHLNWSEETKKRYCVAIWNFLDYVQKPIERIEEEDVVNYLNWLKEIGCKPKTLEIQFMCIRRFLRFCGIEINFKLKLPRKVEFPVDPSQFLSNEEFEKLLSVLTHPRDIALITLIRETGMRIGEALSLNVGDIEFEEYGKVHIRHSKSAERYVEFVWAVNPLKAWLTVHPDPKPDNPLFVKLKRGKIERLTYDACRKMLERALKKAGLKKKVTFHIFRHQVATELLTTEGLTEEAIRRYLGWKPGSKMISRYSHVTSEKANELVLKTRYGIKTRKEREEPKGYRECPRCARMIEVKWKACPHCGFIFDRKIAIELGEAEGILTELLELLKDPEIRDYLRKNLALIKALTRRRKG